RTETKTIEVKECECVQVCDCGTLSVIGPAGITPPGQSMTFTANATGGSADVTYNWSVSSGTIESGQGTPSIVVSTTNDMANTSVTATVELGGLDPACNCPSTASEVGPIGANPEA